MKFFPRFLFIIISFSVFAIKSAQAQSPSLSLMARDTIWLMNGERLVNTVIDTSFTNGVRFTSGKKNKQLVIESEKVFSVKFSNGMEKINYTQDTAIGNDYSVEDARLFIIGEQNSIKNFKSPMTFIGSLALGGASAYFLPMSFLNILGVSLSPIPPFAFTGIMLLPPVNIKSKACSNPEYLKSEAYVSGFEKNSRKIRTMNSLRGGLIGLAAGFLTYYLVPPFSSK